MIYDLILKTFEEALPTNFMLSYNNNLDTNWSEILKPVEDKIVHGVMRVDSGDNEYVGTETIKTENMRFTFAIPNEKQTFSEAIEAIENLANQLNDLIIPIDTTKTCKIIINGRSSGAIEVVNRVEWVVTDLYFQIQIYADLISSNEVEITINSSALDVGIIDVVYDYALSTESKMVGSGNVPTNYNAGAQKQLIITVVPQTGSTVYSSLLSAEDTETTFAISYNNGITTRTFNAKLIGINEHVVSGGTYVAQIKFLRTK